MGDPDDAVVDALAEALEDEVPGVRENAVWALYLLGSKAAAALPALVSALTHQDVSMRRGAALALGKMGPLAAGELPHIAEAIWDDDSLVRAFAARALGRIGPKAQETLPFLVLRLMAASYWKERNEMIEAAGRIGKPTGFFVPKLVPLILVALGDSDARIRCTAAEEDQKNSVRERASKALRLLTGGNR